MTETDALPRYRQVPADLGANAMELELLQQWTDERLFARTLAARAGGEQIGRAHV